MYNPYTVDMCRTAVARMTRKAEICESNAFNSVPRFNGHWLDLALEYRREASRWQADLNELRQQECA
jgi:hypothetical protein